MGGRVRAGWAGTRERAGGWAGTRERAGGVGWYTGGGDKGGVVVGGKGCFSFGVQTSGEYISTMFGCI